MTTSKPQLHPNLDVIRWLVANDSFNDVEHDRQWVAHFKAENDVDDAADETRLISDERMNFGDSLWITSNQGAGALHCGIA